MPARQSPAAGEPAALTQYRKCSQATGSDHNRIVGSVVGRIVGTGSSAVSSANNVRQRATNTVR